MLICPAVHIPTRSLLRSSSTPEPSDPLYSIVHTKAVDQNWPVSQKTEKKLTAPHGGESNKKTQARAKIFERICHHRSINSAPHPKPRAAGKHKSSRANKLRTHGSQQRPATGRQASSPRISLEGEFPRILDCKVPRL